MFLKTIHTYTFSVLFLFVVFQSSVQAQLDDHWQHSQEDSASTLEIYDGAQMVGQAAEFCQCEEFEQGANENWPHVLAAATLTDGNMGEAQSFQIIVTSLPEAGVNFRVAKTVANGNWYFAPDEPLELGVNTKTVSAVTFARAVKFQFSDCNVEYSVFTLNDEGVCGSIPLVLGCMDENACNYDPIATEDDQTCFSVGDVCDDGDSTTINDAIGEDCMCLGEDDVSRVTSLDVNVNVFPNPCSDLLSISADSEFTSVLLRDVSGKVLFSQNNQTRDLILDMTSFPNNIYILELYTNGHWQTHTVSVSH